MVKIKAECKICQTKKEFETLPKDYRLHSTDNLLYCNKCRCLTSHIMIEIKKEKTLFQAFTKGFSEAILTMWAVFDIPNKEIKEKLHTSNFVNRRIFELYNLWMGF